MSNSIKIEAKAQLNTALWPVHEPRVPDMELTLGDYRNHPPDAVKINGTWYAVGYDNNFTSYSGGGTGPINCRLYTAKTLGRHEIADELSQLDS